MARFLLDTSCMVAAVCAWHEHHQRSLQEIQRRLSEGDVLVSAAPALVETYSVLTRLPPPHRMPASVSLEVIAANFMRPDIEVIALTADEYRELLRAAPGRNIAGGLLYDAVIMACASAGHVDALLTFNERQYRTLTTGAVEVSVPH